jgi:glutathione synthase/RimK-type ligase-like ATP-grasp enzyme
LGRHADLSSFVALVLSFIEIQNTKRMKKIGILHGKETTFPEAFVARVNAKNIKGVQAEPTLVSDTMQGEPTPYAVMIDRISQDVPFYRAYLKNAALNGTAVLNNPFWWSADEKYFNNCLSTKIGVPVPRTVLLPSKQMPPDTSAQSFRNLQYPFDWEKAVEYLGGFPLYMKPHSGGGWKSVYKVDNFEALFDAYNETGTLVMLLQETIDFTGYFRCYCLGGKYVRIMDYEPRNPHHLRYVADHKVSKALREEMHGYVLRLNHALGYDFNTVEFAIRDGIPYAIDFCNPAPDADVHSVGEENFEWVVENAANMTIEKALAHKDGVDNLTWGSYVAGAAAGRLPVAPGKEPTTGTVKKASGKASKVKKA